MLLKKKENTWQRWKLSFTGGHYGREAVGGEEFITAFLEMRNIALAVPGKCDESVACLPSDWFLTGKPPEHQTDI